MGMHQYRKKPLRRPRKQARLRKRRVSEQRCRVELLGYDAEQVKQFTPGELRLLLRRPARKIQTGG